MLGKGSRYRVVAFGEETQRALRYYFRARRTHSLAETVDWLWLGSRGRQLTQSGVAQMLRRRCAQAGMAPIHPHQFRHSAAAFMKRANYSEGEMMSLFGWRSTTMLHRYGAAVAEEQALEAYRRRGAPGDQL